MPNPRTSTVIDCTAMTVTAGLWNSHVHILPVELLHADEQTGSQLTSALQEMLTRWGFTTVFDIASILANTNAIRTRIASGEILGPRILTTGEPFFPLHGVPSYVSKYLDENRIILPDDLTMAAAVERVLRELRAGADGIKIFAGSIEGDSVLLMPSDRARAIVQEAHRLHRPVFVHPSNLAGIDIALNSGDGDILFGTDVGYIYQFDTSEEYALTQRAGMTFPQILASLTINPARRFGFADHSGRIAVKMDADLTVFRGDPGTDISAFSRVSYTIRAGKVIFRGTPE